MRCLVIVILTCFLCAVSGCKSDKEAQQHTKESTSWALPDKPDKQGSGDWALSKGPDYHPDTPEKALEEAKKADSGELQKKGAL